MGAKKTRSVHRWMVHKPCAGEHVFQEGGLRLGCAAHDVDLRLKAVRFVDVLRRHSSAILDCAISWTRPRCPARRARHRARLSCCAVCPGQGRVTVTFHVHEVGVGGTEQEDGGGGRGMETTWHRCVPVGCSRKANPCLGGSVGGQCATPQQAGPHPGRGALTCDEPPAPTTTPPTFPMCACCRVVHLVWGAQRRARGPGSEGSAQTRVDVRGPEHS